MKLRKNLEVQIKRSKWEYTGGETSKEIVSSSMTKYPLSYEGVFRAKNEWVSFRNDGKWGSLGERLSSSTSKKCAADDGQKC